MTPALIVVTTRGRGYNYCGAQLPITYKECLDGEEFKKELAIKYPKATIEWSNEKIDFNDYLIQVPSKAMARRMMWELGRRKSLAMYWTNKFYKFFDDETGEDCKLYSNFFYRNIEKRKEIDEKVKENQNDSMAL